MFLLSERGLPRAGVLTCTAIIVSVLHQGCSDDGAPPPLRPLEARPANPTCLAPPSGESRVRFEPMFGGAIFETPTDMVERSGRYYVSELAGRVQVVDGATNAITTAVDLRAEVGEQGRITGLALHPTKPQLFLSIDHWFAPYYSELWRVESKDGGATFDPSTRTVILRVERPSEFHGIGQLRFDARGLLYVAHGDGGSNGGESFTQYDPTTLLGSMFRLDVDGAIPYAIPPDNPYAGGGGRPEIYAGGLRNPFRFSFDRETGELWAGDVGESRYEEVNVVERGKNYGWPALEANVCMKPRDGCDRTGKEPPVYAYAHSGAGGSITGGFVYRGRAMPDMVGRYIFGDFVTGRLFALPRRGDTASPREEVLNAAGPRPAIVSFAEDGAGELYAVDLNGQILRLGPGAATSTDPVPRLLSQTGCVSASDATVLSPALIPYGVNSELWSDGADKERFFAIPDGTTITVDEDGKLLFPSGSVVMKTFALGGKRIETRLLTLQGADWTAYSYAWNDAQTEATRVDATTVVRTAEGTDWEIPGPNECFTCHKGLVKTLLGLELSQLAGAESKTRRYDQLPDLVRVGLLDPSALAAVPPPLPRLDGEAPAEARARAYLHTNCSFCHRPNGGTPSGMDMRRDRPLDDLLGCLPSPDVAGLTGGRLLSPGDPSRSAVIARMSVRGNGYQMPPLGTRLPDTKAIGALDEWIGGLPPCP